MSEESILRRIAIIYFLKDRIVKWQIIDNGGNRLVIKYPIDCKHPSRWLDTCLLLYVAWDNRCHYATDLDFFCAKHLRKFNRLNCYISVKGKKRSHKNAVPLVELEIFPVLAFGTEGL